MQVARFKAQTKCFYDPEGLAAHQRTLEKEKLRDAEREGEDQESARPAKYHPAAPEQFKPAVCALKDFNVIKYPRVL